MAAVGTTQYLQDELHRLFDQDNDTPTPGGDEWNIRLGYLNRAIRRWENVDGIQWRELWTTSSAANTTVPANFRFPAGYVRVVVNGSTTHYPVLQPEHDQLFDVDTTAQYAYFTGNDKAGFTLNVNPALSGTYTVNFDYYKKATELTAATQGDAATEEVEMSNPDFAIYYALAEMYHGQYDLARYNNALATAEEFLADMQIRNQDIAPWQDASAPDLGSSQGVGFGS